MNSGGLDLHRLKAEADTAWSRICFELLPHLGQVLASDPGPLTLRSHKPPRVTLVKLGHIDDL